MFNTGGLIAGDLVNLCSFNKICNLIKNKEYKLFEILVITVICIYLFSYDLQISYSVWWNFLLGIDIIFTITNSHNMQALWVTLL